MSVGSRSFFIATLWVALQLVGCWPKGSTFPRPEPPFAVQPYVVAGSGLWLRWEAVDSTRAFQVRLLDRGQPIWTAKPTRVGLTYGVQLPIRCGAPDRYGYSVTGMSRPQSLVLPPCPAAPSVTFALLTDTQGDPDLVHAFAQQIARGPSTFVLHGGDFVNVGGSEQQWHDYHAATQEYAARLATVATIGNHERYWDQAYMNFGRYFAVGQRWYTFSAGPVDVVVINSEDIRHESFNRPQRAWLGKELQRLASAPDTEQRWRIVLTHHAPFSSGLANAWVIPFERGTLLRRDYVPVFERHEVQLVLTGHTHIYERSQRHGIHYVVGGASGGLRGLFGSCNPYSTFLRWERTYSQFVAERHQIVMTTYDVHGKVIDRLVLRRQRHAG